MGLAAVAALCAFAPDVSAEPTVLIVETRGSPSLPTLASQVELHSHGTAGVRTQTASDSDPMAFAGQASALVTTGQATVVIWVAPIVDGYLVFAAGKWPGRALIELVRVDAAIDPAELERTIALKVTGLLDSLLSHGVTARAALDVDVVRHVEWRVETAGALAYDRGERGIDGRVSLAVGRATVGEWSWGPVLAAYWQPSTTSASARGGASLSELGASLAFEAGWRASPFEIVGRPQLAAAAVVVRGRSDDGRTGHTTLFAPTSGLQLGVRYWASEAAAVGLAAGAEVALYRHLLVIDDETVADLRRIRLQVGLTLTVSL